MSSTATDGCSWSAYSLSECSKCKFAFDGSRLTAQLCVGHAAAAAAALASSDDDWEHVPSTVAAATKPPIDTKKLPPTLATSDKHDKKSNTEHVDEIQATVTYQVAIFVWMP